MTPPLLTSLPSCLLQYLITKLKPSLSPPLNAAPSNYPTPCIATFLALNTHPIAALSHYLQALATTPSILGHQECSKQDQGRSKKEELSKFEAKNQEKEALEVVSRHFPVKVIEQLMARSDTDLKMAKLLASAAIFVKMGVLQSPSRKHSSRHVFDMLITKEPRHVFDTLPLKQIRHLFPRCPSVAPNIKCAGCMTPSDVVNFLFRFQAL
ncbi:hypothetical protein Tco_0289892 [Tanacetum coccineum]